MENATKALLISATILITIVLIAIGVLIIRNMSNTSDDANKVAEEISNATNKASIEALGGLKGTIISKEKFNEIFEEWKISNKGQIEEAISLKNEKLKNQIEMIGWVYTKGDYSEKNGFPTTSEAKIKWCQEKEKEKENGIEVVVRLDNPFDNDKVKDLCKDTYERETKNSDQYLSFEEYCEQFEQKNKQHKPPIRFSVFWTYDETGYINKVYFLAGILYSEKIAKK